PGARTPGALREAVDDGRRELRAGRAGRAGARPATHPGRLHAPLRPGVRRAALDDRLAAVGTDPRAAPDPPQPLRAEPALPLRDDRARQPRARGRLRPLAARRVD